VNKRGLILLIALTLSIGWYFFVGVFDRQLAIHQYTGLTVVCLHDYQPEGRVASPEGGPRSPKASYDFFPLGIHCQFTITGGPDVQSFHPRPALVLATLPLAMIIGWGAWKLMRARNRQDVP
jgi:hypothetical protein